MGANPATFGTRLSGDGRVHGARHWVFPGLGGIAGLSFCFRSCLAWTQSLGLP